MIFSTTEEIGNQLVAVRTELEDCQLQLRNCTMADYALLETVERRLLHQLDRLDELETAQLREIIANPTPQGIRQLASVQRTGRAVIEALGTFARGRV